MMATAPWQTMGMEDSPFMRAQSPVAPPPARGLSAQDTFAALTRAQWDEYLSTYVPLENLMINYATDPNAVSQAVSSARRNVGMSFDAQQGVNQRRMRGLGLTLDSDEQRAADRSSALARSAADVTAANLTADRVRERQQGLMGNPAPVVKGGF
jgi:hypothetical protein